MVADPDARRDRSGSATGSNALGPETGPQSVRTTPMPSTQSDPSSRSRRPGSPQHHVDARRTGGGSRGTTPCPGRRSPTGSRSRSARRHDLAGQAVPAHPHPHVERGRPGRASIAPISPTASSRASAVRRGQPRLDQRGPDGGGTSAKTRSRGISRYPGRFRPTTLRSTRSMGPGPARGRRGSRRQPSPPGRSGTGSRKLFTTWWRWNSGPRVATSGPPLTISRGDCSA